VTSPTTERYFFVHLQKTGGTTLIHRLARQFRISEIYPDDSDVAVVGPTISVDHLLERWPVRREGIRIVTGHFPLCTAELLRAHFTTLTVLRHPVARTLSYLRHHRELTPADRDKPLEAIYEDPIRFHGLIHNHMVKMLSLTTVEMTDGALSHVSFTEARLARAKENLAKVDVVGVQEQFSEFWDELSVRFGWRLGALAASNRTTPVDVPDSFRRRIAVDNAFDIELYQYALMLLDQRAKLEQRAPVP
jgi:hypothetical protein